MKRYFLLFTALLIGAFLMQGFQCASPDYTTAKLAMKNRDYQKAEEYFEKELKKNPQNAEAWAILAEAKMYLNKIIESNEAVDQALKYSKNDAKILFQLQNLKRKLWIDAYTGIIDNMNKYYSTKDIAVLDTALYYANTGVEINPDIYEFIYLRGTIYKDKGDIENAVKDYKQYYKQILSSLEFAKENNIFIGADRNEVIKKLGKPQMSPGTKKANGDSSITDIFVLSQPSKENPFPIEFYIQSDSKDGKVFDVVTWRYNPPPTLSNVDKLYLFSLNQEALIELVQYYYDKKEYDKSMNYLNSLLILEPMSESANSFMITLYDEMGKKDEATKRIEQLVKSDPNNKIFRFTYGNLLMQLERFDEAIAQYEAAIKIDENYYDALRNAASAYKNKAVQIQKTQKAAVLNDQSGKTKMNPEKYLPFINKSGKYFERCRKSPKYANDYAVLFDLADIYYVADDIDKLKYTIAELEGIESLLPEENKEAYYLKMIRVFQQLLPNEKKSKKYEDKVK